MWGREKVACCRTKAAISLKRVKIEEKLLWTANRNSPTLFRMAPSLTPYGLPFPKIGSLQLSYHLLSQEQVKLRTSNLAGVLIPEFYMIFAQNIFPFFFWGGGGTCLPCPPSPTPMELYSTLCQFDCSRI